MELFILTFFGKNKVQYKNFDWKVAESEHFMVMYYSGGEHLKDFAIYVLEEAYEEFSSIMPKAPKGKIPVLIYNSPDDFRQTNVIFDLIDEGVGGFTEAFKKRVVLPFSGSYDDFRHVLRHELVHVFQYEMLSATGMLFEAMGRIPLWSIEGMAEYVSIGWDISGKVFVRDLVLNDLLVDVDELAYYGGYLIYKQGQAIYYYIDSVYGRQKLKAFISNLMFSLDVEKAIKKTFNMNLTEFSRRFRIFVKEMNFPHISRFHIEDGGRRITNRYMHRGFFNIAPCINPQGDMVAFISDREQYTNIYLSSITGNYQRKIVSAQTKPDLENLHLLNSKLTFSPDGRRFAFVARGPGYDILHIYDVDGKLVRSIPFKDYDGIRYPDFSKDGRFIALVVLDRGRSDVAIYDLQSGKLERITNDYFTDLYPSFDDEGNIYFVSDRNDDFRKYGNYAVFKYSEGKILRTTPYLGKIHYLEVRKNHPVIALEYDGTINAFEVRGDKAYMLTRIATGIYQYDFDAQGNMVASMQVDGAREIFYRSHVEYLDSIHLNELAKEDFLVYDEIEYRIKDYRVSFSLDWIAGAMSYVSTFGALGYLTLGISDYTGDNWIILSLTNTQDIENATFFLYYLYLKNRWDLNVTAYQYWTYTLYDTYGTLSVDKPLGFSGVIYYPFNRFDRMEFGLNYSYITRYYSTIPKLYTQFPLDSIGYMHKLALYVGFSRDKALYYPWGPVDGSRIFFGVEYAPPILKGFVRSVSNTILLADVRYYWRLARKYTFALRIAGGRLFGADREGFIMYDVRGWNYFTFFYGNNFAVLNAELRYPFVEYLKIGFPIPLTLSNIRGALFYDMGYAWFDEEGFRFVNEDGSLADMKASFGFSIRFFLGFADLVVDAVWLTDLRRLYNKQAIWAWYLAFEY